MSLVVAWGVGGCRRGLGGQHRDTLWAVRGGAGTGLPRRGRASNARGFHVTNEATPTLRRRSLPLLMPGSGQWAVPRPPVVGGRGKRGPQAGCPQGGGHRAVLWKWKRATCPRLLPGPPPLSSSLAETSLGNSNLSVSLVPGTPSPRPEGGVPGALVTREMPPCVWWVSKRLKVRRPPARAAWCAPAYDTRPGPRGVPLSLVNLQGEPATGF